MAVPCVRVPTTEGERTRERLAELGLLSDGYTITAEEGSLYIPVSEPASVPDGLEVVEHDVPERAGQTLPADILGWEPSYERLGDIVIVDEDDPERARALADALVDSSIKAKTVVNRASPIEGELRVRDWELLAGEDTETVHREYGCSFALDIASVYFSPRLATERHRVTEQVEAGERVFDMFAGVGPFVIPAAKRGAECVGVDLNPAAVDYLRENAERNGVTERVTAIEGDVRNVVAGASDTHPPDGGHGATPGYEGWADRVVMNLPHSADAFLETAVALASEACTVHYYDIQPDTDPFGPGERAIREAADGYGVEVLNRRVVRSYAPHEENVCLDVRLTR